MEEGKGARTPKTKKAGVSPGLRRIAFEQHKSPTPADVSLDAKRM